MIVAPVRQSKGPIFVSISTSSSSNSKRKFQYATALTNTSSRMTRYGLKQCKRYQWSEVNIDFISPQQDLIAEAILSGLAISSTCPESIALKNGPKTIGERME